MPQNATKKIHPKEGENGDYLFSELNDPAFEEAISLATRKIMADSSDISKAAPGEQLEYLTPGEKPPGETPVRTTQRGARGYYPSEVAGGEEEAAAPREAEPTEEREIEAVQAPEAKTKAPSEYPKRIFDHATEQYLRVIVPDNPDVHGVEPGIHSLKQPQGAPVRGKPISIYDSKIPETVYHMTTNAPAVRASKKLIAGGVGGLGGDTNDQIISLTINKEIAYQLAEDTKLASEISRMGGGEHRTPERTEASKAILKRLNQEMEKEGWHSEIFSRYSDDHYEYMHEGYNAKEWLAQYFTFRARETANLGKEKLNPLFFTDPEDLAKINPENVDVIEIPKSALRTGAMITDFDLDNRYGLQEIRIYGDVGVSIEGESKTLPNEMKYPVTDSDGNQLMGADYQNAVTQTIKGHEFKSYVKHDVTKDSSGVTFTIGGIDVTAKQGKAVRDEVKGDPAIRIDFIRPGRHAIGQPKGNLQELLAVGKFIAELKKQNPNIEFHTQAEGDSKQLKAYERYGWERIGSEFDFQNLVALHLPLENVMQKSIDDFSEFLVLDTVTLADDSIRIGNLNIPIEVATDPASGLSGRDRLAPNTGMLFIFDKSPVITMKGMKFPLDIVWMADNKVVDLTENALVPVLESASLYTPKKHATTALEINGGEVQTLGIKIGDSVEDAGSTQSNLSKLLVLETALEYLAKVESGKREYLSPGEKAPEGLKEYPGSRPGVRYYVPGESKSKQEFPSMHTLPSDVQIQPEFPREEREVEAVSPGPDFAYGPGGRIETRQDTLSEDDYREQFAAMSNDLEDVLSSINPEHKQFLGTPFDDSKLIGDNLEYVAFTDGSFEGSIRPSGSGIHSEYNFTVFIEGKPFIYKIVPGENRAEHLSYSIDRALGLDVVPYIKPYNMDIDKLHKVFQRSQHDFPTVAGQRDRPPQLIGQYTIEELKARVAAQGWGDTAAAGHFMEFCETCPDSEESAELIADMLTTTEGREEFFKLMLLDYVSGNDDRHSGNWLVTKDKKALAIDNGFGGEGGYAPLDETINRNVGRIGYSMKLGFPWRVQNALKAHFMDSGVEYNQIQGHLTRIQDPEMLGEEADNTFDKYYNLEKIQKALAPINWDAQSVWPNIDDAREAFRNHAVKWMIRGSGGKAEGDYSSEVLDESSNRLEQEQIAAIQARLGVSPPESGGFLNRIRNWIRLGGPDPKSSAPSSREFHPEFEGDTPPSQRGGPQQGRRGRN